MKYKYIILDAKSDTGSGFGRDFDIKFNNNTRFISSYISRNISKLQIPTSGNFNMLFFHITKEKEFVKIYECYKSLNANIHVSEEEISDYCGMTDENMRFEYYLSLLERGYRLTSNITNLPMEKLLKINQDFREGNYINKWIFKKKRITEYGIKVILYHVLTSYDYKLHLSVFDLKNHYLSSGDICTVCPQLTTFGSIVRNLLVTQNDLIITGDLDKPRFVCHIEDLVKGIIKPECVDYFEKYLHR